LGEPDAKRTSPPAQLVRLPMQMDTHIRIQVRMKIDANFLEVINVSFRSQQPHESVVRLLSACCPQGYDFYRMHSNLRLLAFSFCMSKGCAILNINKYQLVIRGLDFAHQIWKNFPPYLEGKQKTSGYGGCSGGKHCGLEYTGVFS
jgi:hypothetical protein